MEKVELKVTTREAGRRIDVALMEFAPKHTSRTVIQNLIKMGKVTVNSLPTKPSYKLKDGDFVEAVFPPPEMPIIPAENIPLDVIYEDDHMIVVNKQAGLVTHPTVKKTTGTLVNALLWRFKGETQPFIVHRLDKDTSGVILVAKDPESQRLLSAQFKARRTKKTYLTLVEGIPKDESGEINAPIARNPQVRTRMDVLSWGRNALSKYETLKTFKNWSLLKVRIMTGRTHQIRVHMKHIGHPVVGDQIYGVKPSYPLSWVRRQLLHAVVLEIYHPFTNEAMRFVAPLAEDFKMALKEIAFFEGEENVR
ncbi:RluA family pseudouridine synthase [Mesoaciditoga sp.]